MRARGDAIPHPADDPIVEARAVECSRSLGRQQPSAVRGVSLSVRAGERVWLCGPAGSGRTLLLHVLGLLEAPDAGEVRVEGRSLAGAGESERGAVRGRMFGFLFSAPYLLPDFSVAENIAMPLFKLGGSGPEEAEPTVQLLLQEAGLSRRAADPASGLGASEQWRVALARALVLEPRILVIEGAAAGCEESRDGAFRDLLEAAVTRRGLTLLCEAPVAPPGAERVVLLEAGRVISDSKGAVPV